MNDDVDVAHALLNAGVRELDPDTDDEDQMLPLHPDLVVEHATAKAVLFVAGSIEHWVPKAALRVDEPECYVMKWFVDANNEWGLVA